MPVPAAVALMYTAGVCLGLVVLVISRGRSRLLYLLVPVIVIMGLLAGGLLAVVPDADD